MEDYDVEVLTTCVRDVATGEKQYPEGTEEWNKKCWSVVLEQIQSSTIKERCFAKKAKPARKLRQFLLN